MRVASGRRGPEPHPVRPRCASSWYDPTLASTSRRWPATWEKPTSSSTWRARVASHRRCHGRTHEAKRMRIILAEDDPVFRELTAWAIRSRTQHEVIEASTGTEVLDVILGGHHPDVLVL